MFVASVNFVFNFLKKALNKNVDLIVKYRKRRQHGHDELNFNSLFYSSIQFARFLIFNDSMKCSYTKLQGFKIAYS